MEDRRKELELLISEHGKRLYQSLLRLTLRPLVAEDLMQELALKLLQTSSFWHAENRVAYAHRAAINLALTYRRRQRYTLDLTQADQLLCPDHGPLQNAAIREQVEQLLAVLPRLSRLQREVFVLHHIDGLDHDQVAEVIGKSSHQVRGLVAKAIGALRRLLATDTAAAANLQGADHARES